MKNKNLLIVFVKNSILGKVKTRLANTIGNENALIVYKKLLEITKEAVENTKNCDTQIYYSDEIIENEWLKSDKFIQQGINLGEKMKKAFSNGFNAGYKNIVLIGSDLSDITSEIIHQSFELLKNSDVVFGPAEDGGYYLVGMKKMQNSIFEDKPWSTDNLLSITLYELTNKKINFLKTLNDIDLYEDLKKHPSLMKLINKPKTFK